MNKPETKRMIASTNKNIMQISNKIPLLKLHLRRQWHGGIQPTGDDRNNKSLKRDYIKQWHSFSKPRKMQKLETKF